MCVCTAIAVHGRLGGRREEEDDDVEMLRFRKAKRKERSKMKHLGCDQ